MDVLSELRQLNLENPGSWPTTYKFAAMVLLLVAVIAAGYFMDWKKQWEILEQAKTQEETLKQSYLIKKRSAVNLVALRQQQKEIEQSLGALLKQLPDKSEMEALLVDINQAGLGRGLQFELFKPASSETVRDFYAELPVTIRVTGNYHDIGAFASDVAHLPRIVTLNDINIEPDKEGSLVLNAVAKTFRFLDDDEVVVHSGVSQ